MSSQPLSPEDYLRALEEYNSLSQTNPLWTFKPHQKQQLIQQSDAKYLWIFGGNRSGKTEINIVETAREWDGTHEFRWLRPRPDGQPCLAWMCSETSDVQRDTLQVKFDRYIPREWVVKEYSRSGIYDHHLLKVPNARYGLLHIKLVWKTYDQGARTYESASVDQIVADEEPPEDIFSGMEARLLDAKAYGNGWYKAALTPTEGKGWSVEKFWSQFELGILDPDTFCIKMSTYENAHNLGGPDAVAKLEAKYPEHERAARIHGDPRAKFGYVLDKYIDRLFPNGHLIKPFRPDWNVMTPYESCDYGYSNPTSIGLWAAHMNGDLYRYDEIYVRNHTIPQVKGLLWAKRKQYGYHEPRIGVMDRTGKNRDTSLFNKFEHFASKERNVWIGKGKEPSEGYAINLRKRVMTGQMSQSEFDKHMKVYQSKDGFIQFPVNWAPANNNRNDGWEVLNDSLVFQQHTNRPKVFVTENCIDFRREARTAKWKSNIMSTGKNVAGDDHAIDEARYMVNSNPLFVRQYNGIVRPTGLEEAHRVRKY